MVDYKYKDLFFKPHTNKKILITADDGSIKLTNSDLHSEDFELNESLCSESELKFGSCEASSLKFRISNVFTPMKDKWLTVTETLAGNTDAPFQYGKYKVFSDTPTADRRYRDITAYDAMYDIINSSAISWYNTILPNKDIEITMKQFRTSFATYFGLEQEEITLANDDMIVEKTIEVEESIEIENETEQTSIISESTLSGLDVLRAICEINGCFGHIGRDGKLHYIYIKQDIQGLYPAKFLFPNHVPEQWDYFPQAETGKLYPQSPKSERYGTGRYISCSYEDFVCRKINKIQIREKENDIGAQYPKEKVENQNAYIIEDNFLVYGKKTEDLEKIAKNIYEKVKNIVYRPFNAECVGNPCLEVGDAVRFSTKYELVESYVLNRTFKGIQSPRDSFSTEGEEYRSENVNSVGRSILQLKGKTNRITRTVEETVSELKNLEENTETNFIQTAEKIEAEAKRASDAEGELSGKISVEADRITAEVERASSAEGELSGRINVEADRITSEVSQRQEGENELSSRIEQTVKNIILQVDNGEKTAGITITLESEDGTTEEISGTIEMTGIVTFNNLETEGQTIINGDNIKTGTINCDLLNGGTINGQTIVGGTVTGTNIVANEFDAINKIKIRNIEGTRSVTMDILTSGGSDILRINKQLIIERTLTAGAITSYGNIRLRKTNEETGEIDTQRITAEYKDGSVHDAIVVSDDLLTTGIGWNGSGNDGKSYNTVLNLRGKTVNAPNNGGLSVTSDERLKNSFKPLDEFDAVYMDILPCAFKYNNGSSGRYHFGTTAQGVKEAFEKHGYTTQDFAGFVQMEDRPENEDYCGVDDPMGLIYTEFTTWNMHMAQKLYKIIEEQQAEIDSLKESVSFLMERI